MSAEPLPQLEAFAALVDETRLLFHRLRRASEQIHGQGELTAGRRGVLHANAGTSAARAEDWGEAVWHLEEALRCCPAGSGRRFASTRESARG